MGISIAPGRGLTLFFPADVSTPKRKKRVGKMKSLKKYLARSFSLTKKGVRDTPPGNISFTFSKLSERELQALYEERERSLECEETSCNVPVCSSAEAHDVQNIISIMELLLDKRDYMAMRSSDHELMFVMDHITGNIQLLRTDDAFSLQIEMKHTKREGLSRSHTVKLLCDKGLVVLPKGVDHFSEYFEIALLHMHTEMLFHTISME